MAGGGDQWTNVTVDGKKVNVHEWRVNIDSAGTFQWRGDIDASKIADTLKETWRVPTKGMLEFDLITSNPMCVRAGGRCAQSCVCAYTGFVCRGRVLHPRHITTSGLRLTVRCFAVESQNAISPPPPPCTC